jgi:hypothetical protein
MQPENPTEQLVPARPLPKWKQYLKRFGILAFLFFLLKGIAWLIFIYYGIKLIS